MAACRLLLAASLAVASLASAQTIKVERYRLSNGMTVILHEDHTVPMAAVNIWYGVGSRDEAEGRTGFAHLFEHLMFMGTQRVPRGQFDEIMESQGGTNNASTIEDRTNFYSIGPSNLLPTLLWLDAERLESLGENIDQAKLDLQRDVVRNERRESVDNAPYGEALESINSLMYPKGHPYAHSVIGSMDDLSAAGVSDVRSFFSTYYVPNNASLVVAGDFDSQAVKPLIARMFGTLPRHAAPPRRPVPPADLKGVKRATFTDRIAQPKILMVWHAPPAYQKGSAEAALLAGVLTDGTASRLYRELVMEQKVATDVSAWIEPRLLDSLFYLDIAPSDDLPLDKVEASVDAALADFRQRGPTADELARQTAKVERGMLEGLQNLDEKADRLNEYQFYLGDPNGFERVLRSYRDATAATVKAIASSVLDPDRRLVVRVVPEGDQEGENPRDKAPTIAPPITYVPPLPTRFVLSNGIRVDYWHRPELPLMRLTAQFKGGSDDDPADRAGLSALTADLADEGTRTRTSDSFAKDLDRLGIELQVDSNPTDTRLSFTSRTKDFARGTALVAEALAQPRLDEQDFERLKEGMLADIQQGRSDPSYLATVAGMSTLFGPHHPEGRFPDQESVEAIELEDVKAEHAALFRPSGARLFAAGSLSAGEAKTILERAFGKWKGVGTTIPEPAYPAPANRRQRLILIDRPGATQTTIRIFAPGFPYRDPRRTDLEAAANVFGGSFTSRLNQNLRERYGYTYGAGASYVFHPSAGSFSLRTDVRTDATGAALREIVLELGRLRSGDITADEATKAGSTMRSSAITPLASLKGILDEAADLAVQGQEFAMLSQQFAAYEGLNPDSVNRAIRSGLSMERAVIVLVGDRSSILPQIQDLGLPEPEERD